MESFPFRPLWLQKLSARSLEEVRTKNGNWPDIKIAASTSNTVLIHITGPLPLLQEWERAIRDHEANQRPPAASKF